MRSLDQATRRETPELRNSARNDSAFYDGIGPPPAGGVFSIFTLVLFLSVLRTWKLPVTIWSPGWAAESRI